MTRGEDMRDMQLFKQIKIPSAKALAVTFNADASRCAVGDRDGFIHIIETESGTILRKLKQHVEFVYALAMNPDNGCLVSVGKDRSIREWDIETGNFVKDYAGIFIPASARTLHAQNLKPTTRSHSKTILTVALEKGGLMATGSQDKLVKLWKNGEPVRTYDWHSGPITCVRFQPETHVLFSASKDKTVRSWSDTNGALIHKYSGHLGEIMGMEFIDDTNFVTVDALGQVLAWNVDIETPLGILYETSAHVLCATLEHSDNTLLLGLENGMIEAIHVNLDDDVQKQERLFGVKEHQSEVRALAVSEKGWAASGDNSGMLNLWKF